MAIHKQKSDSKLRMVWVSNPQGPPTVALYPSQTVPATRTMGPSHSNHYFLYSNVITAGRQEAVREVDKLRRFGGR